MLRYDSSKTAKLNGAGLRGQFFYRDKLGPLLDQIDAQAYCKVSDRHVAPRLAIWRRKLEDILCINIRGGDIFRADGGNPGYVQPPLSFYLAAIAHDRETYRITRVKIVFQDRENPIVDALEARLDSSIHTFEMYSGTVEEDAEQVLNARYLVLARSTFTSALALMANGIQAAYTFHMPFRLDELRYHLPVLHVMHDLHDKYICPGEWQNTSEQRQLMIEYPGEHLAWE